VVDLFAVHRGKFPVVHLVVLVVDLLAVHQGNLPVVLLVVLEALH